MLTQQCPHCGSYNVETASVCYFCKKELPRSAESPRPPAAAAPARAKNTPDSSSDYRRPGCVTVYAVLIFLSGFFGICSALITPSVITADPIAFVEEEYPELGRLDPDGLALFTGLMKYYLICFFVYSVGTIVVGWGIWTMRNWARIIILFVQGFSLAVSLFALFYSIAVSGGSLIVCGVYSISVIFPAWVFLWFFLNRRQFR